jgi:uncharacterized protein
MNRYLFDAVLQDLSKKMVFITGPRQVGKTHLAKEVGKRFPNTAYLNYDDIDDASIIRGRNWPSRAKLVIFDEIHKMSRWKPFLKGTFDTHRDIQTFLITGSARLDTFRQTGESLAGRYFHYHLYPLSVKEIVTDLGIRPDEALSSLIKLGGFPEPFLSGSAEQAQRWRGQYLTDLVREDILDFGRIQEIRAIRTLLEMLKRRVGSPISYVSLAQDLQVSPNTVKRYIEILESLYIIFLIRPFHKNIARSLLKEPKLYFYDSGCVEGDDGMRLENTVAVSLRKQAQWFKDKEGREAEIYYGRTKEKQEIDFILSENDAITECIEVKQSGDQVSPSVRHFRKLVPHARFVQIVDELRREKDVDGVEIRRAADYLAECAA